MELHNAPQRPTTSLERARSFSTYLLEDQSPNHLHDPYQSAFARALGLILAEPKKQARFAGNLDNRLRKSRGDQISLWGLDRLTTSAGHMIEWGHIQEKGLNRYQTYHTDPFYWLDDGLRYFIEGDYNNPDYLDFIYAIESFDINTIKPGRRNPPEFVMKTNFKESTAPVNMLDVGCSRNDILVMIAHNMPERTPVNIRNGDEHSPEHTALFDETVRSELPRLGSMTGIDLHPYHPNNIFYGKWFESNYLRFQKAHDQELVRMCKRLGDPALRRTVGVKQVAGDFSEEEVEVYTSRHHPAMLASKYDLINFSFMLNQLSPSSRDTALKNASTRLPKGGVILVTDFVEVNPEDSTELIFPDSDAKGPATIAYFEDQPKRGFQELFHWDNGDCVSGSVADSAASEQLWAKAA